MQMPDIAIDDSDKVNYLHYLMGSLIPFIRLICKEQSEEIEIEASILGMYLQTLLTDSPLLIGC